MNSGVQILKTVVILMSLGLSLTSCEKIVLPRITHADEKPISRIPLNVALAFDKDFRETTLGVDACAESYEIEVGKIMTEYFIETAGQNFASVTALGQDGAATPVAGPTDLTIHLSLIHQSFDAPTR